MTENERLERMVQAIQKARAHSDITSTPWGACVKTLAERIYIHGWWEVWEERFHIAEVCVSFNAFVKLTADYDQKGLIIKDSISVEYDVDEEVTKHYTPNSGILDDLAWFLNAAKGYHKHDS